MTDKTRKIGTNIWYNETQQFYYSELPVGRFYVSNYGGVNEAYYAIQLAVAEYKGGDYVATHYMYQAEGAQMDLQEALEREQATITELGEITERIDEVSTSSVDRLRNIDEQVLSLREEAINIKAVVGEADEALNQRREEISNMTQGLVDMTAELGDIQAQAEAAGSTLEETLMLIEQAEETSKETTKSIEQIKFGGGGDFMRNIAIGVGAFILILVFGAVAIKGVMD